MHSRPYFATPHLYIRLYFGCNQDDGHGKSSLVGYTAICTLSVATTYTLHFNPIFYVTFVIQIINTLCFEFSLLQTQRLKFVSTFSLEPSQSDHHDRKEQNYVS